MSAVSAGNLRMAGDLYDRYHSHIYGYYLKRCGDKMKSEDLMHTVFERLIRYRASYDHSMCFRTWIFTICRNLWIDESKKRNEHSEIYEADIPVLNQNDDQAVLIDAINRLAVQDKELILMAKIEGFKYREIAEMMNITEVNVKVKVYRCMKQLKDILVNELGHNYGE